MPAIAKRKGCIVGISRSFKLETTLSNAELLAPFELDVVEGEHGVVRYLTGTMSELSVRAATVQHEWQYSFGVRHNTILHVRFDREMVVETDQALDDVIGPFIKAVDGDGWMQHLDIAIVHWNGNGVRLDSSLHRSKEIGDSIRGLGLEVEFADLVAEYDSE